MSAGRWRVYFLHLSRKWVVRDQNDEFSGGFRTLPEAHTHAMKLARTVEVELPKPPQIKEEMELGSGLYAQRMVNGVFLIDDPEGNGGESLFIHSKLYQRAAELFLALHYDYERNQK